MFYNYYKTKKFLDFYKSRGYQESGINYALKGAFKHNSFFENKLIVSLLEKILPCFYIQKDLSELPESELELLKNKKFFRIYGSTFKEMRNCPTSFTFIINLHKNLQDIFKSFDYSLQKQIKKAQGLGLYVSLARDEKDYQDYYNLLKTFRDKRGFGTESLNSALAMWRTMHSQNQEDSCYEVFLCRDKDKNLLSGMGIIINPEEKIFIEVASARSDYSESRKLPDNDFLKFNIIEWGNKNQMNFYDLAGVNPSAEQGSKEYNIFRYKAKWGGELQKICHQEIANDKNIFYRAINFLLRNFSRLKK